MLQGLVLMVAAGWGLGSEGLSPEEAVKKLIAAFNAHDVDAMVAMVDPKVQWLSLNGSKIAVEADGSEALAKGMGGYFKALPSARSTVESIMVSGSFVAVRERAHWSAKGEDRSQAALAVYQVRDGKILRVWYYPAEP